VTAGASPLASATAALAREHGDAGTRPSAIGVLDAGASHRLFAPVMERFGAMAWSNTFPGRPGRLGPLLIAAIALAAVGCGTPRRVAGLTHPQALANARRASEQLMAARQHACRERRPSVRRLVCRAASDHWDCPISLSDGSGGSLRVPAHGSGLTIIC
jgi:hypothetical protein